VNRTNDVDDVLEGFEDCVDNLREIVTKQRDEIARQAAIIAEYRLLHGIGGRSLEQHVQPPPVYAPAPPPPAPAPAAAARVKKPPQLFAKRCEKPDCGKEYQGGSNAHFCKECIAKNARERMRTLVHPVSAAKRAEAS
jgi:hypothetical protein